MEYLLKKGNVVKKTLSEEKANALQASGFEPIQKNDEMAIIPETGEKSEEVETPEIEERLEEIEAFEDKTNQESAEVEKESKSRARNKKTEDAV